MILDQIVDSTRKSVAQVKSHTPLSCVKRLIRYQDPPRDFVKALNGENISLIAEVKRASPSKGLLCPNLAAASLARTYSKSGAAAISVLTEPDYFWGSFADLESVHTEVEMPVLCKDFIVDRYQIHKARAHGADAVLLIVAILSQQELGRFLDTADSLGMAALVEIHNHTELERALKLSPRVLGINNRNLADFRVDLTTTIKLRPLIPDDVTVVSESGIHTRDDVLTVHGAGVNAILVGEALVTSPNPSDKIGELMGTA